MILSFIKFDSKMSPSPKKSSFTESHGSVQTFPGGFERQSALSEVELRLSMSTQMHNKHPHRKQKTKEKKTTVECRIKI